jgi:hypothetical protein
MGGNSCESNGKGNDRPRPQATAPSIDRDRVKRQHGFLDTLLLTKIWNSDIRNSYSHAAYSIDPSGDLHIGESDAERPMQSPRQGKIVLYSAEAIEELSMAARWTICWFTRIYDTAIRCFKDGRVYPTTAGKLRWYAQRSSWGFDR